MIEIILGVLVALGIRELLHSSYNLIKKLNKSAKDQLEKDK